MKENKDQEQIKNKMSSEKELYCHKENMMGGSPAPCSAPF